MKSIAFPNFLNNVSTTIIEDHDATLSNLKLLLLSDKISLLGDPYYGTRLKSLLYDQNNKILRDLIIEDVYSAIMEFMPQIVVNRNDIKLIPKGKILYINIKCTNILNYTNNLYEIRLLSIEE